MPTPLSPEDRLRTFESNFGRDLGWFLEKDGEIVAALVEPQLEEMFWHSYLVEGIEGKPLPDFLFDPQFWHNTDLVFRNRGTGEIIRGAFAGGTPPTQATPRVAIRGLYSQLRPTLLEKVALWFRRRPGPSSTR